MLIHFRRFVVVVTLFGVAFFVSVVLNAANIRLRPIVAIFDIANSTACRYGLKLRECFTKKLNIRTSDESDGHERTKALSRRSRSASA